MQSFSLISNSLRGVLIVGLAIGFFVSCAPDPQTNGKAAATANASLPEQPKSQTPMQGQVPAAARGKEETLEARLTELFELCRRGDLEAAAAYFVYRGPDKGREWKDVYRATDPVEKTAIESLCRRIKGYLDESQGYQFGGVKVKRESEGEWHGLEVFFRQGDKTEKALFAFLLVNGRYAIGDID